MTTRLAPSPTGALHLGNARTFLVNWAMARQSGWRIVLRIEDLDGPRVKPGADRLSIDLLTWLGIDWDVGPVWQSTDLRVYRDAMDRLARAGAAYSSTLSRADVERLGADADAAADGLSAPQEGSHEVRFPAGLRPVIDGDSRARGFDDDAATWRFVVAPGVVSFADRFAGMRAYDISRIAGDFIVWTRQRMPAYQLAVVVDDARQGVIEVVRGDDLLDSAARQLLLYRALGLGPEPRYTHIPLVRGEDGKRLAKRHGDTRLDTYRATGVPAERVIGLVAFWCGMVGAPEPMSAGTFCERFTLDTMPRDPITFRLEDDAWLRKGDR
jgi:glutamyl-tRNA synthetase